MADSRIESVERRWQSGIPRLDVIGLDGIGKETSP